MLLERKVAMALGTGAGAIEWLWNINAMMRSQQEVTIGVIRPDGTERPETRVMEEYASFVAQSRDHFQQPAGEDIAILSSQALQYSTMSDLASAAVSRSVRVIHYDCHTLARVVSENNVDNIRGSKLVILPSAQMLRETTWKALISYVEQGGNLLITGPAERDEHWRRISRLSQLGVHAAARALTFRGAQLQIDKDSVNIGFPLAVQQRAESLEFQNGASYVELKHGRGRLFVVAYPVELAESAEPTRRVYENVLSRLGIAAPFEGQSGSASILIRPVMFADSILYLMVSESAQDENIDIRDRQIGAKLKFVLPAQRAKMILLGKKDGVVLGSYDPPLF
jgi:endo-1,4-beta-mannosidase